MLRDAGIGAVMVILLASVITPSSDPGPYDLAVVASIGTGCAYHNSFLYIDATTVFATPSVTTIGPGRDLIPGITTPTPQYVTLLYNTSETTTLHNPRHIQCVLRVLAHNVVD